MLVIGEISSFLNKKVVKCFCFHGVLLYFTVLLLCLFVITSTSVSAVLVAVGVLVLLYIVACLFVICSIVVYDH